MPKIHCLLTLLVLFFLSVDAMVAQNSDDLDFGSNQLSEISEIYAGSANNWPIVRKLANFNYSTNRFYLGPEEVAKLEEFLESWKKLDNSRQIFSGLSTEGGQIFAPQELSHLDSLFTLYRSLINDADMEEAITLAERIVFRVEEVSRLVEERRIEDVEAKLEEKTGQVDRRRGLLSEWINSVIGDLYYRSDGIRTGTDSQAQLLFIDGSDVVLYENTTAVINQSRVDKLTNRSEVEIELSGGSLLTRLTAIALNDSQYRLNAGTSTSEIRSNNFWVESLDEERVTLSNYDGEVLVGAEQMQVSLLENEGTIVLRGREPVAPIRLLPAPELNIDSSDILLYTDNLRISWSPVSGASFYETVLSAATTFDAGLRVTRNEENELNLESIPEGISYIQVRAFDENGLRGNSSRTLRVFHIVSDMPPPVILDTKNQTVVFSFEPLYILSGTTEPGVNLRIDGQPIPVDENGRFEATISIEDEKAVQVVAENSAGISREITQIIRYVDADQLFDLQWSVRVNGNQVYRAPRILISGRAHHFMNVEILVGDHRYHLPVGSSGRWAREIQTEQSNEIFIRFTDKNSGETVAEKTFNIISP